MTHTEILTPGESTEAAARVFCTFGEGRPELVPTGIQAVDRAIGGLFKGATGILAAGTGVGKSRAILEATLNSSVKVGISSQEDTADVFGCRLLARLSGVDSKLIRTKRFNEEEFEKLQQAAAEAQSMSDRFCVAYNIASPIEDVLDSIKEMVEVHGCEMIWVDYIQKIRGESDDRRNDVARNYGLIQRTCHRLGVPAMVVSQFSRQPDPYRAPQIWWLKESGDLENEARLIVLLHREKDSEGEVLGRVAKSTFGGEGVRFVYEQLPSGMLKEVVYEV